MTWKNRASAWVGTIALFLSLVAFTLGSAPFTPALVLIYLSIPMALLSWLLGAWRLSFLATYFGAMAWFVVPLAKSLSVYIDQMLLVSGVLGCVLGVVFYVSYLQVNRAT